MTNEPKKLQLHQSHLNMFDRCQISFCRRYGETFDIGVDGRSPRNEIIPPGISLITGTATHASVAANLSNRLEHGEPLDLGEAKEVAFEEATALFATAEFMLTEKELEDSAATIKKTIDTSVALSELHYKVVAPTIEPVAVEEPFVVQVPGYDFDLAGQMDVIEKDGFRDTKTAKATPSDYATLGTQADMYAYAHLIQTGIMPESVSFDYLIKLKTPKAKTLKLKPNRSWMDRLSYRLEVMATNLYALKRGLAAPTPAINATIDWVCTKNYCGYSDTCRAYSGR